MVQYALKGKSYYYHSVKAAEMMMETGYREPVDYNLFANRLCATETPGDTSVFSAVFLSLYHISKHPELIDELITIWQTLETDIPKNSE